VPLLAMRCERRWPCRKTLLGGFFNLRNSSRLHCRERFPSTRRRLSDV